MPGRVLRSSVGLPGREYGPEHGQEFRRSFEKEYLNIYQRLCSEIPIEGVNWRLSPRDPARRSGGKLVVQGGKHRRSPEGKAADLSSRKGKVQRGPGL